MPRILNPTPTSLPTLSLWAVPEHWLWVPSLPHPCPAPRMPDSLCSFPSSSHSTPLTLSAKPPGVSSGWALLLPRPLLPPLCHNPGWQMLAPNFRCRPSVFLSYLSSLNSSPYL